MNIHNIVDMSFASTMNIYLKKKNLKELSDSYTSLNQPQISQIIPSEKVVLSFNITGTQKTKST